MDKIFQRERYNYDMSRYVELPNYNDYVVQIDFNDLTLAVENYMKLTIDGNGEYNDEFVKNYFDSSTVAEFEEKWAETEARRKFHEYLKENTKFIAFPQKEYEERKKELLENAEDFQKHFGISFDDYIKNKLKTTLTEYIQEQMKDEMLIIALADKEGIKPTCEMIEKEKEKFVSNISSHYIEEHGNTEKEAISRAEIEFENQGGLYYAYENVLVCEILRKFLKYSKKST